MCVSGVCACTSVRHSGLMSMFVLGSECCFFFFVCSGTRPSKENRRPPAHEDSVAAGRRQPLLVCATMLSSPVSCQNRKRQRQKWRLGKCCLDVCWPEVQLRPTVTLLDRKNRPIQGVTPSGILHGVIFITLTKRGEGMLSPAVDTGLDHFCREKTARSEARRPIWLCPLGWRPDTTVGSV